MMGAHMLVPEVLKGPTMSLHLVSTRLLLKLKKWLGISSTLVNFRGSHVALLSVASST